MISKVCVKIVGGEIRYGQAEPLLEDINLQIQQGALRCIVGPSGAGKSSLLKVIYMGRRLSQGQLTLFDRDTTQLSATEGALLRRRIGVVFQDFNLLPHLSVMENVALPLRVAGVRQRTVEKETHELLEWIGLSHLAPALPETLSGGQQQRIAVARAVIGRPNILLADEPTGNVDHRNAARLLHLFQELNRIGTTVLIATHSREMAEKLSCPLLRITSKKIIQESQHPPRITSDF